MKHQLLNIFLLQLPGVICLLGYFIESTTKQFGMTMISAKVFSKKSFDTDYETFLEKNNKELSG